MTARFNTTIFHHPIGIFCHFPHHPDVCWCLHLATNIELVGTRIVGHMPSPSSLPPPPPQIHCENSTIELVGLFFRLVAPLSLCQSYKPMYIPSTLLTSSQSMAFRNLLLYSCTVSSLLIILISSM